MFLFSRKNRQLLGLDITTSSIKLIELANSGGRYVVESYAAEATPATRPKARASTAKRAGLGKRMNREPLQWTNRMMTTTGTTRPSAT